MVSTYATPPRNTHPEYDDRFMTKLSRPTGVESDIRLHHLLGQMEKEDKIVVYAFGAFDRYYICWQDNQGQYRQERHGLPLALERWLFPSNGTKRDLETLQVSLGHNDEFFAFDKYDRISHINSELRDSRHSIGPCSGTRPDETVTSTSTPYPAATTISQLRRKSHTFSFSHSETSTTSAAPNHDLSLSNQRIQLQARKKPRPRSIAITGILSLKGSHERNRSHDSQRGLTTWPEVQVQIAEQSRPVQSPIRRRPLYTHACVQTEPIVKEVEETYQSATPDTSTLAAANCFHHQQNQDYQHDNDTDDVESSKSTTRTRDRSISILSHISLRTVDSGISLSSTSTMSSTSTHLRNPINMGAMNRYFRESQYRLGDSLIRATTTSIDVGAMCH